jgi:PAS domain S-box-containing protein
MSDELAKIAARLQDVPDPVGLLGTLFAHAPVGFQIWSASGHSLLTNSAFRALFGSEPPPEYNCLRDELAEAQGVLDNIKRAFAGETVHVGPIWYDPRELRQVHVSEGRRVAIEITFFPLIDRDGTVRYVASAFKDVTAEMQLRASEQNLASTLQSIGDGVIATDNEARVVRMNPAAEGLTGLSFALAAGRHLDEVFKIINEQTRKPVANPVAEVLRGNTVVGLANHTLLVSKDGTERPIADSAAPIRDAEGRTHGAVLVFSDQTQRKREEEIRARSTELEFQNRRIQEASRLKSEFLANMSHELRTPLNAVIGFAELLYDGQVEPGTSRYREFLGDILSSGRHLLRLINDVLDLAKVEAGKQEFRPEPVELPRLVAEVCAILRASALHKRIRVETQCDETLTDIVLDPARLKQVLFNYLSNALKFTPAGGRVIVRVWAEDEETFRLEVEDNGIGIAPGDIGKLFVEFQQLDAGAAKRHQGTGLGLVLTRKLVEAQGGSVGVRSRLGEGSLFQAILPRRAAEHLKMPALPRPISSAPPGAPTLLVVEDELSDQQFLVEILNDAGYAVELAATGAEALAFCNLRRYHAVTLDLLLPDMSGLDLLAGIRAAGKNRDVPVIVVTIVPSHSAVAGFTVQDVLHKPLEARLLLDAPSRAGVLPEQPGTILVVDDDKSSLRLMEAVLGQLGYRCTCRSNGADGLTVADELAPLAIIVDLMMPGMDGFEFLERLRRLPGRQQTPVIVWSVKELTPLEQTRLRESALGVISKGSLQSSALIEELRALLPRPPENPQGAGSSVM